MSALKHYDEFFAKCRQLLKPKGRHAASHDRETRRAVRIPPIHSPRNIFFPGYHLPALKRDVFRRARKFRLIASDVDSPSDFTMLYTLEHWLKRTLEGDARAKSKRMYDERFFRMWEYYLAGGIVMFEDGAACNYQVQYVPRSTGASDHSGLYGRRPKSWIPQDRSGPGVQGRSGKAGRRV